MANTYKLIEAQTLTTATASVTFSSIPQTYTDLILTISTRPDSVGQQDLNISFNSDTTAANYPSKRLLGTGSSVLTDSQTYAQLREQSPTSTANTFSNGTLYIPNYTGSAKKSSSGDSVSENNATAAITMLTANLWDNTAAITSITIDNFSSSATLEQYSSFYLYGIKNS